MAGNSAFEMVSERGWRRGLNNLLSNELRRWWGSKMWWIQMLIWGGIIGGVLASFIWGQDEFKVDEAVMIYGLMAGIFPAIAVIIIMQDVLVGEKQEGTAAWVLSKPVSRQGFIISKLVSNAAGVLATMVLAPGIVAYTLLSKGIGHPLPLPAFLLVQVILFTALMFYLTLTLMLGTLFKGRGPVIGIALAFTFGQQYLVGMLPFLAKVLPWGLTMPPNNDISGSATIISNLILGKPVTGWTTIIIVIFECALMAAIAIWRFNKEEF